MGRMALIVQTDFTWTLHITCCNMDINVMNSFVTASFVLITYIFPCVDVHKFPFLIVVVAVRWEQIRKDSSDINSLHFLKLFWGFSWIETAEKR